MRPKDSATTALIPAHKIARGACSLLEVEMQFSSGAKTPS